MRVNTRIAVLALPFVLLGSIAVAQSAADRVVAKAEDQAQIKVLVDAEVKAKEALDAKIRALPEYDAWKLAAAKSLDTAYKLQAKYQLSSREYEPKLNEKGELTFVKLETKP